MLKDKTIIVETVSFEDDQIYCVLLDSQRYVVVKSIIDALGLDYSSALKRLKNDRVLKDKYIVETIQLPLEPSKEGAEWFGQTTKTTPTHQKTVPEWSETNRNQGRKMVLLRFDYIQGWLFKIPINKVKGNIQDKLGLYQEKCFQVLENYFNGSLHKIMKNRAFVVQIDLELERLRLRKQKLEAWKRKLKEMSQKEFDSFLDYKQMVGQIHFDGSEPAELVEWISDKK